MTMTNTWWVIFGTSVVAFGTLVAFRARAKGASEAIDYILGFTIVALGVIALVVFALPNAVAFTATHGQRQWSSLVSQVRDSEPVDWVRDEMLSPPQPDAGIAVSTPVPEITSIETVSAPINASASQYTVQNGDTLAEIASNYGITVNDIVQANNLVTPDKISVGQVLIIPGKEELIIVPSSPTATASLPVIDSVSTRVPDFTAQIGQAMEKITNGDRDGVRTIIGAILLIEPDNEPARNLQNELGQADELSALWEKLGDKAGGQFVYGADAEIPVNGRQVDGLMYVTSLLSGYSFEIVDAQDIWLQGDKDEIATVRCTTPGWMYGETFAMQRYIANQFDKLDYVSDGIFTVK